jgi:hypothetical protein
LGPIPGLGSVPGLLWEDPRFSHARLRSVAVRGAGLVEVALLYRRIYLYLYVPGGLRGKFKRPVG